MSFLYHYPAPEYRQLMNKEGQVVPTNQLWNKSSGTYRVSVGLGVIIVSLGIMVARYQIWLQIFAVGGFRLRLSPELRLQVQAKELGFYLVPVQPVP